MEKITEEQGIHKEWYDRAKKVTLETLPSFIKEMTESYEHDYGTICHAIAAAGIATMYAINHSPQGGITGFQAGAIMWEFITHWQHSHNKCGLKLTDYDNMLYPQYEHSFSKRISTSIWENLQKEASKLLAEERGAPEVRRHWQEISDGLIPFGYSISKED